MRLISRTYCIWLAMTYRVYEREGLLKLLGTKEGI